MSETGSGPSEIVAFVRERLAEREAAARGVAVPDDWTSPRWFQDVDAEFIALNDPAYVLADIAAKRRILDLYEAVCERVRNPVSADARAAARVAQYELEGVVRLLATIDAGHPDFDPAWKF